MFSRAEDGKTGGALDQFADCARFRESAPVPVGSELLSLLAQAQAFKERGEYDSAIEAYERLLSSLPKDSTATLKAMAAVKDMRRLGKLKVIDGKERLIGPKTMRGKAPKNDSEPPGEQTGCPLTPKLPTAPIKSVNNKPDSDH